MQIPLQKKKDLCKLGDYFKSEFLPFRYAS